MGNKTITFQPPPATYWFFLAPALIAHALISGLYTFTALAAIASFLLQTLKSATPSKRFRYVAVTSEWILTFAAFLYFLIPFWPNSLTDFAWAPLAAILLAAALAASLPSSQGWGRPLASFLCLSALLFFRNLALFHDFHLPYDEWMDAIAFIAFVEILRSNRYSESDDTLEIELRLSLLLALIASFAFSSLWLAAALSTIPLIGFLLAGHRNATTHIGNKYISRDDLSPPRPSRSNLPRTFTAFALITALAALPIFLLVLRIPAWTDHLKDAPYLLKSYGKKVSQLAAESDLELEPFENLSNDLISFDWITDLQQNLRDSINSRREQIAENNLPPSPPPLNLDPNPSSDSQDNASSKTSRPHYKTSPVESPIRQRENQPDSLDPASLRDSNIRSVSEMADAYKDLKLNLPPSEQTLSNSSPNESPQHLAETPTPSATPAVQPSPILEPPPLDLAYLNTTPNTDSQLATDSLNMEPASVTELLDEKPLLIAKLENNRRRPERLYLRVSYLDTITENDFYSSRRTDGRQLAFSDSLSIPQFQTSENASQTLTLTAQANRFSFLPIPDSFTALSIPGADTIAYYPNPPLVSAPLTDTPVTYTVSGADLLFHHDQRIPISLTPEERTRLTALPLSTPELDYLNQLTQRIAPLRNNTRQFARKAETYLARKHPYSFSIDIPQGPGHPATRWLRLELPGLCSNYAAAFTLLARARGIPTRIVIGYASYEYESRNDRFIIRRRDAHAWVEYLDESNRWIRTDPTPQASPEELRRVADQITAPTSNALSNLENAKDNTFTQSGTSDLGREPSTATLAEHSDKTPDPDQPTPPPSIPSPEFPNNEETTPHLSADAPQPTEPPSPSQPNPSVDSVSSVVQKQPNPITQPEPNQPDPQPQPTTQPDPSADSAPSAVQTPPNQNPTPTPSQTPQPSPTSNYNPWLIALLALTLIPIFATLFTKKLKSLQQTTDTTKLRTKAGRLLREIDTFILSRSLFNAPNWQTLRSATTAQRYGPNPSSTRIQELHTTFTQSRKTEKTNNPSRPKSS